MNENSVIFIFIVPNLYDFFSGTEKSIFWNVLVFFCLSLSLSLSPLHPPLFSLSPLSLWKWVNGFQWCFWTPLKFIVWMKNKISSFVLPQKKEGAVNDDRDLIFGWSIYLRSVLVCVTLTTWVSRVRTRSLLTWDSAISALSSASSSSFWIFLNRDILQLTCSSCHTKVKYRALKSVRLRMDNTILFNRSHDIFFSNTILAQLHTKRMNLQSW